MALGQAEDVANVLVTLARLHGPREQQRDEACERRGRKGGLRERGVQVGPRALQGGSERRVQ